ncbi:CSMD [Lepeophtheirus salmonis]|uniref:CSMD n=1 Tax=Lepeophtheirus salmonis TaxID=72036 RepID=A0A7R8CZA1_LEPSM|nr:CSMD [Lepeophtheirus salmonis]CAF2973938.1 CSMD [Lepeophtheirus salmonis]
MHLLKSIIIIYTVISITLPGVKLRRNKLSRLGDILRNHVTRLRANNPETDLVFCVDSSASVGPTNFYDEIKFIKKLLADFTVSVNTTRVAIITYSSVDMVYLQVDYISHPHKDNHKCQLFQKDIPAITYNSGGTYTLGALRQAYQVFQYGRPHAKKAIFLITDGYSNGGDPRPVAKQLRTLNVEIFTFGIRNGNIRELRDISSFPKNEHSFILESFEEFEALARRALHKDLSGTHYLPLKSSECLGLCYSGQCCDEKATCACGAHTGHYACLCPKGHYGRGLVGDCIPCPSGTYKPTTEPGDIQTCLNCPFEHQTSFPGSSNPHRDCFCKDGFEQRNGRCVSLSCPDLSPPRNGHFFGGRCQNVVHEACAFECRSGYSLSGGSALRVCLPNGTWSGNQPECKPKRCKNLSTPRNGKVKCASSSNIVDSECQITCNKGYRLIGSKRRVCLPISLWSGLPSYCKPLKCHRLRRPSFGQVYPVTCQRQKQLFGRRCAFTCHSGFKLLGPALRKCVAPGMWDGGSKRSRCIDITPPSIKCPEDTAIETLQGKHYGVLLNFSKPIVDDNSGYEPNVEMYPAVTSFMKLKIGINKFKYVASDVSGNKNRCTTVISVRDEEPPVVDVCSSPPVFLTQNEWENVEWDEPIFHDNSLKELQVTKSRDFGRFDIGTTIVHYTATDTFGNVATCDVEITLLKHFCSVPDDPINGHSNCTDQQRGIYCTMSCSDGYALAMSSIQDYECNYREGIWKPKIEPFPDCSIVSHASLVVASGVLTFETSLEEGLEDEETLCDHPIMNTLSDMIKEQILNSLSEICDESFLYCDMYEFQLLCRRVLDQVMIEKNEIIYRRKRENKKVPVSVILQFLLKASQQIITDSLKNSSSYEINDQLFVVKSTNITHKPKFVCSSGSVPMKNSSHLCVNCPVGTFYNTSTSQCQYCSKGYYQDMEAQLSCIYCPEGMTTKQLRGAKSKKSCQRQCIPGTYSEDGFEPCSTCIIGFYQEKYGEIVCKSCPDGFTTTIRGSDNLEKCRKYCQMGYISDNGLEPCYPCPSSYYQEEPGKNFCNICGNSSQLLLMKSPSQCTEDFDVNKKMTDFPSILYMNDCFSSPCSLDSICRPLTFGFQCVCSTGFTGTLCDKKMDGCLSNPCNNGGICSHNEERYSCKCAKGFKGVNCELDVNECEEDPSNICANGGTCTNEFGDYQCTCQEGFTGKHCLVNLNNCHTQGCFNGGTCQNDSVSCLCPHGFSGQFCEVESTECISSPCINGGSCMSIDDGFRCLCPLQFEGHLCETEVRDCRFDFKCLNGGSCVATETLLEEEGLPTNYKCECGPDFRGKQCEIKLSSEFILHFDSLIENAAVTDNFPELDKFTFCFWMQTLDTDNYGTPFSYSVPTQDNEFTLTDYNGFVLSIKGEKVVTDITANDGTWTFICGLWSSLPSGTWRIYKNGILMDYGHGLAKNKSIEGNGIFVLGQEQDSFGGNFSQAESFKGKITKLSIWNVELLTENQIMELYTTNQLEGATPVISWNQFRHGIRGSLNITAIPKRQACPILNTIFPLKVHLNTEEKSAGFSCHGGYVLEGNPTIHCGYFGVWSNGLPQCIQQDEINDDVSELLDRSCSNSNCTEGTCGFNKTSQFPNGTVQRNGLPLELNRTWFNLGDQLHFFFCNDVFRIEGESQVECGFGGIWTPNIPICVYKKCTEAPKILHGYPILPSGSQSILLVEGIRLFYSCEPHFEIQGRDYVDCLDNGTWSMELPRCIEILCDQPPVIPHATQKTISSNWYINSTIQYECEMGFYSLSSHLQLECLPSGTWSVTANFLGGCHPIDCGLPPSEAIVNTYIEYVSTTYGSQAKYYCNSGYVYKHNGAGGNESIIYECTFDGQWASPNGVYLDYRCLSSFCTSPDFDSSIELDKSHMLVINEIYEPSDMIALKCKDNFRRKFGDRRRTCLSNGNWSGTPMECVPKKCYTSPRHNEFLNSINQVEFMVGSKLKVSCPQGFHPSRESIECVDENEWSINPLELQKLCFPVTCSTILEVENGISEVLGFTFGTRIHVACKQGYEHKYANEEFTCSHEGVWVGSVECVDIYCEYPSLSLRNGIIIPKPDQGTKIKYGEFIEYSCNDGFYMSGSEERVCGMNGALSGSEPICWENEQICPSPDLIENGIVTFPGGYIKNGDKAIYSCNHQLVGEEEMICMESGEWSGTRPYCIEDCLSLSTLKNGQIIHSYESSILQFECDPGYELKNGKEVIDCKKEFKSIPTCEPVECLWPPPTVENAYYKGVSKRFGDSIVYHCQTNYTQFGSSIVWCNSQGQWSSSEEDVYDNGIYINCVQVFCYEPPSEISHGWIHSSSEIQVPDASIEINCHYGYRLLGLKDGKAVCNSFGEWSPVLRFEEIKCVPITCQFPQRLSPFHGSVVYPGMKKRSVFHVLEKIHFKCNRGYIIKNGYPRSITCTQRGQWTSLSRVPPICQPIRCSKKQILDHSFPDGAVYGSNLAHGEMKFSCDEGYHLVGHSKLKCLSNGKWSENPPICFPYQPCSTISPSLPHVLVKHRLRDYTYTTSFSCRSTKYSLSNPIFVQKDVLVCNIHTQQWYMLNNPELTNFTIPECAVTQCDFSEFPILEELHAQSLGVNNELGSVTNIQCHSGFEHTSIRKSAEIICSNEGIWQYPANPCRPKFCSFDSSKFIIKNGSWKLDPGPHKQYNIQSSELIVFGDSLIIRCNRGYELNGFQRIKCVKSGKLHPELPKCEAVHCEPPENIPYGVTSIHGRYIGGGNKVTYKCKSKYNLIGGFKVRECLYNKTWTEQIPDARIELYGLTVGSVIRYHCNSGFRAVGRNKGYCDKTGKWSNEGRASCEEICCSEPPSIKRGKREILSNTVGGTVNYVCNKSYPKQLDASLTCFKEWIVVHWAPRMRKNPLPCFRYICSQGYEVHRKQRFRVCTKGYWTFPIPKCKLLLNCTEIPLINNGIFKIHLQDSPVERNQRAGRRNNKCKIGTRMTRPGFYICKKNGEMRFVKPLCKPLNCRSPPRIYNGRLTYVWSVQNIPLCKQSSCGPVPYIQNGKYELLNFKTVQINETSWQRTECEQTSCSLWNVMNGKTKIHKKHVEFLCNSGYKLVGPNKLSCNATQESIPFCEKITCAEPKAIKNGNLDQKTRKCLDGGSWSENFPTCIKTPCLKPKVYDPNLLMEYKEDLVIFSCLGNSNLMGNTSMRCLSHGEWNLTKLPSCFASTCSFPRTNLGVKTISFQKNEYFNNGFRLNFNCSSGYSKIGSLEIICQKNGAWSRPTGNCQKIYCGRPKLNIGVTLLRNTFVTGSFVPYLCPSSHIPINSPIFCNENGYWTEDALCFSAKDCL